MLAYSRSIRNRHTEYGNALVYILIAIALLAALSYAVTNSNRGSSEQLSSQKARMHASEILEYSGTVAKAVAQLRLRNIDVSAISFENGIVSDYTNGNCGDDTCKIFVPQGGGVSYIEPPPEIFVTAATFNRQWQFFEGNQVDGVGRTNNDDASVDLVMVLGGLSEVVCSELNTLLSVTNPSNAPPVDSDTTIDYMAKYTGTFTLAQTISTGTPTFAKSAACVDDGAFYIFYKVLISR